MSYELKDFMDRAAKAQARSTKIYNWHVQAQSNAGIPLPYSFDDTYVNCNVYDDDSYEIDVEATLDVLAKVIQYANSRDIQVTKTYDHDFNIRLVIDEEKYIDVVYYAQRESVCTKKVVGTEHIEEKVIAAHDKEIIEWECEKIAFLAREV